MSDLSPSTLPSTLILALDVSSTATGFAVGTLDGRRTDWGLIVPTPTRKGNPDPPAIPSVDRIDQMVRGVGHVFSAEGFDLDRIGETVRNAIVVMEWSSGKVHRRIAGVAVGQAVLGHAQGTVRQAIRSWGYDPVLIPENTWTAGRPKAKRAATVEAAYPGYARHRASGGDPGLDMADAIGLLDYYRGVERTRRIVAEHGGAKGLDLDLDLAGAKSLGVVLPEGLVIKRSERGSGRSKIQGGSNGK